jgi:NAD(P)-dependent dehydrogenase (short-subunit alcohol dehydrogenase family)
VKSKKILIIGGATGIGLSVAKLAKKQGASIIIASRTAENHSEKIKKIVGTCRLINIDITSEKELVGLTEEIGNIDHLVITVKPKIVVSSFSEQDTLQVTKAFDIKFWGQYKAAKIFSKCINTGGSLVLSSGIASHKPYKGYSTVSIINGAVESLCKILAIELAPIGINTVSPGFAETENGKIKEMGEKFPLKKLGSTEAIAHSYIFLMKDKYTTGITITTDGGATLV